MSPRLALRTTLDRQRRLREAVAKLAAAIAADEVTPSVVELEALAGLCEVHCLPTEAARVRRWMTP